jgi:hypothetical protein
MKMQRINPFRVSQVSIIYGNCLRQLFTAIVYGNEGMPKLSLPLSVLSVRPMRFETSVAQRFNDFATAPFQLLSNVAAGPIAKIPSTI